MHALIKQIKKYFVPINEKKKIANASIRLDLLRVE